LNVALLALVQLGRVEELFDLFAAAKRLPEAAMFARAYKPSLVPRALQLWREELKNTNAPASQSLADPQQYPNLFPLLDHALLAEAKLKNEVNSFTTTEQLPAASTYLQRKQLQTVDVLQLLTQESRQGTSAPSSPAPSPSIARIVAQQSPLAASGGSVSSVSSSSEQSQKTPDSEESV
jgi:coatomer subunit beta'